MTAWTSQKSHRRRPGRATGYVYPGAFLLAATALRLGFARQAQNPEVLDAVLDCVDVGRLVDLGPETLTQLFDLVRQLRCLGGEGRVDLVLLQRLEHFLLRLGRHGRLGGPEPQWSRAPQHGGRQPRVLDAPGEGGALAVEGLGSLALLSQQLAPVPAGAVELGRQAPVGAFADRG